MLALFALRRSVSNLLRSIFIGNLIIHSGEQYKELIIPFM